MRSRIRSVAIAALAFVFVSCAESSITGPEVQGIHRVAATTELPGVRFSEVHYDNVGTDAGEAIEISGPSGTDLTGWKIVLYNGASSSLKVYGTSDLTGSIPATCGDRGVVVKTYGVNGIQNGNPDGMALVNSTGAVVEFLSWGGTFTAADGPALGITSTDMGVTESNATTPIGNSLQRNSAGDWVAPAASTFGSCNDSPAPPSTAVVARVSVSLDNASVVVGAEAKATGTAFDAADAPIANTAFTWSTSDAAVATVDENGAITSKSAGDVLVIATTENGKSGSASLHVEAAAPAPPAADVVISQIFGGGGNSGAVLRNDYIELFNHGTTAVDLSGWSVQYTSATGSSWNVTPLTGTIQPGRYFLVEEGAGSNASATPLPTADAAGTIAMGGPSGKVILARQAAALTGACPVGPTVNDRVGYGSGTGDNACITAWGARTPSLSNTAAGWRNNDGCDNTGVAANDFSTLTPDPRNSASPAKVCGQPVRSQSSATIVINELMQDPVNAESASWGQWFEVHNYGSVSVDLQGWTIVSGGSSQPDHTISSSVVVPAGGYAVLGRGADEARNGGVAIDYNYFVGTTKTIWLDSRDFLMLVDNTNARVDSVAWTSMPHGVSKGLRNAASENADVDGPNWGYSTDTYGLGDFGTPDLENGELANTAPAVSTNHFSFSGRTPTDAALPVGFEAQIFATELNSSNQVVTGTTFTWSSLTPEIASINALGVIHSLAPGTAVFRVTSSDGTVKNYALPMEAGTLGNAQYLNNTEFGDPVDADASDDYIVRRPQFTSSYNRFKGTPNWVAYDLNGSQFQSGTDRCNCFTHDPLLPADFTHLSTADYTGAGSFAAAGRNDANYGIDRGHMTRSSDRTTGTLDNADTYYLSNVVPQFADLNQGPWNNMEGDLHALAATGTKEIYIITGPAGINTTTTPGSNGTVKNEGKIVIPASTWKIAVIMPRGAGLSNVHSANDVQIIAVNMPNVPGVRNEDWHQWETTVDALEHLTGYNFLAALPDGIEAVVEGRTRAPTSELNGPYSAVEGSSITFSGLASSDPDGDVLTYSWDFGDGSTGTGATPSHTYVNNGSFTVVLTVTDTYGASDATDAPVTISNAAPEITFGGATLLRGESYGANGSFTDPGADTWSATVDYGDSSGSAALALTGKDFSLSHTYTVAGTYTVTVTVNDGSTTSSQTAVVTVQTAAQGVQNAAAIVSQFVAAGKLSNGNGNSLTSKLNAAANQIANGNMNAATNQLQAVLNEIDSMVNTGKLSTADADTLRTAVNRVIASIS